MTDVSRLNRAARGSQTLRALATTMSADRAAFARTGGHARAAALTPKQRSAAARKAAKARWRRSRRTS